MRYANISLIQMDYFLAIAKYLNFTEAAMSLYVSQPCISKQVSLLEKEVGFPLFERNTRYVRLTSGGASLYHDFARIKKEMEESIEKASKIQLESVEIITIGCLDTIETESFLPGIINAFGQSHPRIHLIFERHSLKTLRERLIIGSLDFIITMSFELDDLINIERRTVFETQFCVYMSQNHPKAKEQNVSLYDFRNEKFVFISREESAKAYDFNMQVCKKNGFIPNNIKTLPNAESVLMGIESGLGISLFDANMRIYNKNRINIVKLDEPVSVVLAWKKDNTNKVLDAFISSLH